MRALPERWLDFVVLACAFFLIAHSFSAPLGGADSTSAYGASAGTGTLGKQVGSLLLFCYGFFACVVNRKPAYSFKTPSAVLGISFFLLITASLLWSTERSVSAVRWLGFLSYVVAAAGALKRLSGEDVVRWYVFAQFTYLILGFFNEVRLQAFHPLTSWYRFSGVADDNATGNDAVVLALASIAMLRRSPSSKLYRAALGTAIVILLLTKSRTALFSMIFALVISFCFVYLRGVKLGLALSALAIAVLLPLLLSTLGSLQLGDVVSLGREQATQDTLNGRMPLWVELYGDFASKRPMIGYGYGAFWTPNRIEDISIDQGWSIAAAHSIYLDALLAIGFCGAAVYVATLFSLLAASVSVARRGKEVGFFFTCLLCALLFDGFSDSEPWFIASIYLFASIQALFVLNSLELQTVQSRLMPNSERGPSTLQGAVREL